MGKLMNMAVRLKSQMLKAAPALQNLMMKHLPDAFTARLGQQGPQGGTENSVAQRYPPSGQEIWQVAGPDDQ